MPKNNPHSVDRAYKFIYNVLGITFHQYMYHEGEKIEFIETEIAQTGQRKDATVKVDEKIIQITEFMATPLDYKKFPSIFDYHESTRRNPEYKDLTVKTSVFSIADPSKGIDSMDIDENVTFHINVIFSKSKYAWKVLSTLIYKSVIQEKLSNEEAVDLLVLPDMHMGKKKNMELPIKALMTMIIVLMGNVKFPSHDLKIKIFISEKMVLARFFSGKELNEMVEMLKSVSKDPFIAHKLEEYGPAYGGLYLDVYYEAYNEAYNEAYSKLKVLFNFVYAKKFLAAGVDEEIVSDCLCIPIDEIKKIKKNL